MNLHLCPQLSLPEKLEILSRIKRKVSSHTFFIIGGDFNFVSESKDRLNETFSAEDDTLSDVIANFPNIAELYQPAHTRDGTTLTSTSSARLDRLYHNLSEGLTQQLCVHTSVVSPFSASGRVSDHAPVVSRFSAPVRSFLPRALPPWVFSRPDFQDFFPNEAFKMNGNCWANLRHLKGVIRAHAESIILNAEGPALCINEKIYWVIRAIHANRTGDKEGI